MIPRYTDHSANERTYLAWIRTSISIMAFGFLIEKFDLFLVYINQVSGSGSSIEPNLITELVGIGMFLVGIIIIITSTVRFFSYKKAIESEQRFPYGVKKTNLVLSTLMIAVAAFLLVYISLNSLTNV